MIKESDLIECVLENIKVYVANIAEMETILETVDADRMARELSKNLMKQLSENERRLDKIKEYKARLYENMINGILSKEEHKTLKVKYAQDADALVKANARLEKEIDEADNCNHERMAWINHFKAFENLNELDRKTVIHLIHSIRIIGKTEIEITFNYQSEYEVVLELLQTEGVVTA